MTLLDWLGVLLAPVLVTAAPGTGPRLWVWAWDRPEDLRFLKPQEAGVAFFILGLGITDQGVTVRPRTAPLRLGPGMHRIAVVRLEMAPQDASEGVLREVVAAIGRYALVPGLEGLQLDFDATRSQRPFYRRLLAALRAGPHAGLPITITALASWCMGDRWIRDLPASGAVAMLFQMGPDAGEALGWLAKGRPLAGVEPEAPAWGLGTDQPLPVPPPATARVFLFHPRSWTPSAFNKALHLVQR